MGVPTNKTIKMIIEEDNETAIVGIVDSNGFAPITLFSSFIDFLLARSINHFRQIILYASPRSTTEKNYQHLKITESGHLDIYEIFNPINQSPRYLACRFNLQDSKEIVADYIFKFSLLDMHVSAYHGNVISPFHKLSNNLISEFSDDKKHTDNVSWDVSKLSDKIHTVRSPKWEQIISDLVCTYGSEVVKVTKNKDSTGAWVEIGFVHLIIGKHINSGSSTKVLDEPMTISSRDMSFSDLLEYVFGISE